MRRPLGRSRVGGLLLGSLALLLLVLPTSGGSAVPFTATASFARFGGAAHTGSLVLNRSGRGSDRVGTTPGFTAATGGVRSSQRSETVGLGAYGIEVWAGVGGLGFRCGAGCASGPHTVSITWNLTWIAHLNSTCSSPTVHGWIHSQIRVNLSAVVFDRSTNPATAIARNVTPIYDRWLIAPGSLNSKARHRYVERFRVDLVAGGYYAVTALVVETTYAHSVAGAGCGSGAFASLGTPSQPSSLVSIRVA